MMQSIFISGLNVVTEQEVLQSAGVLVENGRISAIKTAEQCKTVKADQHFEFSNEHYLVPGMIDVHIHGAVGTDVMDATPECLNALCEHLPYEGTTTFLATTMTMSQAHIEKAIENVADYLERPQCVGAQIAGLHLEGPFISKEKLGSHRREYVVEPDIALFDKWQALAKGHIKLVTLAPELVGVESFIRHLIQQDVVASIGHTNANMSQTVAAINAGCRHATHLFNAMSGIHHRSPGAAAAILAEPKVMAELIVDGFHLSPEIVDMSYRIKGTQSLCLVTDSMRAKCQSTNESELGGQAVFIKEGQARLANGVLAGSVLTMTEAFRNMMKFTSCSIQDLVTLTSENPAKQLNLFHKKGSIALKKDADLVVLNNKNEVELTLCMGNVFQKNK